ncbi:MAG TPA: hypothetical protein VGE97_01915 [Nitrososphaera sp.]|jgi:hypothetical protein
MHVGADNYELVGGIHTDSLKMEWALLIRALQKLKLPVRLEQEKES